MIARAKHFWRGSVADWIADHQVITAIAIGILLAPLSLGLSYSVTLAIASWLTP